MAYSDFTLRTVRDTFQLTLEERSGLFASVPEATVSPRLQEFLDEWASAALAMNTEKARSEMIIAPILMEVARLTAHQATLFSGITFDVDSERRLTGVCDFILARSPERFFLNAPVATIVEAKKEDIPGGLGQCLAAMVAAQEFNQREASRSPEVAASPVYGSVTTGNIWRFMRLGGATAQIDLDEYYLHQLPRILGIVLSFVS